MKQIKLTKNIFGDLEVPTSDLIGVYGPNAISGEGLSDKQIEDRLLNPTGSVSFVDIARGKKNIVIVTDDNTRQTPLDRIFPIMIRLLLQAGVDLKNVTVVIGLGTHRPMTQAEIDLKFGTDVVSKLNIINHAWDDSNALVSLGECELGHEVIVNRLATEADCLISIGSIVPHATTGFSAGGKTIMPGICGERTIEDTHWSALQYDMKDILGQYDNEVRSAIVSICRKVGLSFIINTILFHSDRIYDLVCGDLKPAHEKGIQRCREVYGVHIPEKADIVVAEAFPTDIDLRQAIKAICSADIICKDGGVVILPAECVEGVSPQFPNFERYGFKDPEKLFQRIESGEEEDKLLAYTLVAIGRIVAIRLKVILVSSNIDKKSAEHMGLLWSDNLQDAWQLATTLSVGKRTIVLNQAGELLPIL